MFIEQIVCPKIRRDLSPWQCQSLLQLCLTYGEETFTRAADKLDKHVADPVEFLNATLAGRTPNKQRRRSAKTPGLLERKICKSCSYAWNPKELLIFACPKCQAGIVGRDGKIDAELYARYMRGESIEQHSSTQALTSNSIPAGRVQHNATFSGQVLESQ